MDKKYLIKDSSLAMAACKNLLQSFGDLAASEALTRALVFERSEKRTDAKLWLEVYDMVCIEEEKTEDFRVKY